MMVDKWISEDWTRQHALCWERHLMMPGLAHHQGSRSLAEYKETWVSSIISSFFLKLYFEFLLIILLISWQPESHSGQSCNDFTACAMSHMGRATSDVAYNPAAPLEVYTNPSIHARINAYTEVGRVLHGETWDLATAPLSEKPS